MKNFKHKEPFILLAIIACTFTACKKSEPAENKGDAGQTLLKIIGGSSPATVNKNVINFAATPQKLLVVQLRRDVPNETELNKTLVVTVKDDSAAVTAANRAYIQFPAAWYTFETDGLKTGGQGGTYTFTFNPGEFSKEIYITIPNATRMNPLALYGLGFTITSAGYGGKISTQKSVVIEIATATNTWDGVYQNDFCNYHPSSNTGYTCSTTVVHLITTAINKVKLYWPAVGEFANPSILGGNLTYFSLQEPEYTINPGNNSVIVKNASQRADFSFFYMSLSWPNNYDPVTKTFNLKWGYSYAVQGIFDAGCREWTQTLKYIGPR